MKVRNGFVSNSSTTSFCIYGTYLDEIPENEDDDNDDLVECFIERAEEFGLDAFNYWDEESIYIGLEWKTIGDNETGRQFKDRTESMIKEFFKQEGIEGDFSFRTHEEAWGG